MSGWAEEERYAVLDSEGLPTTEAKLAQELYDTGLLYLVNASVLHHFGYALAVVVDDNDQSKVIGLGVNKDDDPDGTWFAEEETISGRRKLRRSRLLNHA
jgi:hypothetical protein